MKYPRNAKIFRGPIDLAPLAGMLLLLLMLLWVSSTFVHAPGLRIELPAVAPADLPGTTNASVTVALDLNAEIKKQFYYENQMISEDALRAKLVAAVRGSKEPLTLIVEADKAVSYGTLARLCKVAAEAGIHDVLGETLPKMTFSPSGPTPGR